MLDPLTAISLASSVVQFTDFGIKLVTVVLSTITLLMGSMRRGPVLNSGFVHVRELADNVIFPLEYNNDDRPALEDEKELKELAKSCKVVASDLLSVLDGLKVK